MSQVRPEPGARIRYMGSKGALADEVARLLAVYPVERPLIDLFGGMCSIAGAVAPSGRQAWANDVQRFAALAAECLLTSSGTPPPRDRAVALLTNPYRRNLRALSERFGPALEVERRIIGAERHAAFLDAAAAWPHAGNDPLIAAEVADLRATPASRPYRLTTLTFAWGYFGLRQSIELDSIRFAVDEALHAGMMSAEEAAWMDLAMLQAASRVASAPGHFAQYLSGESAAGFARIVASRRRSAWDAFVDGLETMRPFGTREWRSGNRVFEADALALWDNLDEAGVPAAPIFYADPPYSKDHYSRYYHVLETLARYDYPDAVGKGRYRPDRFRTPFSVKSEVVRAFNVLCDRIAEREGVLILSYPSSGLLTKNVGVCPDEILRHYFSDVRLMLTAPTEHSTLGSRHGVASCPVDEYVWMAE